MRLVRIEELDFNLNLFVIVFKAILFFNYGLYVRMYVCGKRSNLIIISMQSVRPLKASFFLLHQGKFCSFSGSARRDINLAEHC